ncbi:hypothetical protein D9757_012541 [Collybiopsis confluens]|uniref:Uncharacterized protein n=1 Tax=Collybiopsis confluens TaxID=2823264 RepID=A0A8H5D8D5_9AGAR|nr:hypothetical protein D9757_012541 [Collybiopsis confluens]
MTTTANSKSIRGKWGAAVRRTSSVLSLGGSRTSSPGIPPAPQKSSQTSTGRPRSSSVATTASEASNTSPRPSVDTSPTPVPPAPTPPVPSPIAESPAREAAATAEDVREMLQSKIGPTPLTEVVTAPTETETPAEVVEPAKNELQQETIIGSASGRHTFTEEPDEISLRASRSVESVEAAPTINSAYEPKAEEAFTENSVATEAAPSYFELPTQAPAATVSDSESLRNAIAENTMGSVANDKTSNSNEQLSDPATPRPHGPADTENASVFYAFSEMPVPVPAPAPTLPVAEEMAMPSPAIETHATSDPIPIPQRKKEEDVVVQMPTPEIADNAQPIPQKAAEERAAIAIPTPAIVPYDLGSSQDVWASQSETQTQQNKDAVGRQLADSSAQTLEDPFADPVPSIHVSTLDTVGLPEPDTHAMLNRGVAGRQADAAQVLLPMPVFPTSQPQPPPVRSIISSDERFILETDENQPLLGSQSAGPTSYLSPSHPAAAHLNVSENPSSNSSITWPQMKTPSHTSSPRLHRLGWIEYALPDATTYYSHPTFRVTTDIDLRNLTKLDAVTHYLENRTLHDGSRTPPGYELWLKEGTLADAKGVRKKRGLVQPKAFVPVKYWVDHKKRIVLNDPFDAQGDGNNTRRRNGKNGEDALDIEYRYWAFMEDHPAHVSLPLNGRTDAMDVLTWSWTDRLLSSQRELPPPFTQAECQELNNLLRSFSESSGDGGIQAVLHTRMVSRILMPQWRQKHFRPQTPLPDIGMRGKLSRPSRSGFQRTFLDTMVSVIFLGIPCLFLSRADPSRLDQESGLFGARSAGPMILLGGCTCLVAAIILSASVTFLSLPGLDGTARISGLVAVLLATFSMISSVVALFQYKSDLECVSSNIVEPWAVYGGEGLMLHSRRIVVLSLPVALLAYSIASFAVGIVLYSFFGVAQIPVNILQKHFEEYTRWTVVGVLGGLTGALFTSILLLRR